MLILKRLQTLRLRHIKAAEPRLVFVERRRADPVLAANLRCRRPALLLLQYPDDAIRDCSKRGDVVLDMFGGSGSTLIAADQAGRQSRLIEYDSHYCDVIVARWQKLTGKTAVRLT